MYRVSKFVRTFASLLLFATLPAAASTIQGVVSDGSGAVIPGAIVSITNRATGVVTEVTANESGFYTAPLLPQGDYSVECSSAGFAAQQRPNLRLEIDQTARVDFELNLGTVTEVVEVSAAAQLIQSETTEVGQVIDNKRIVDMPLNLRNYLQLGQFTVGVLPARAVGRGSRQGLEGGFQAIGLNPMQNNVLVDGMDNSSRGAGGGLSMENQAVRPSVDAVSEFKVVTNNTSAEYGYRAAAKVIVSTKSGTNAFHGSLYEFLRNDKLDGTNFFANRVGQSKPTYRQNQFGGTLGGPIIKNRTFFFASYEGTRIRLGQTFISSVPSRAALGGDFSQQPDNRRNVFDPLTLNGQTREQFANNVIPATRFDPVAKTVADLYPAPNIAGREHLPNNFFLGPSQENDTDQQDYRVDHNITAKHRFFARASLRDQFRLEPGPLPLPADGAAGQLRDIVGRSVASNLSSMLGSKMHNEFRFGFSRLNSIFNHVFTENLNQKFGIKGAPGDTFDDGLDQGYARFAISGFNQLGPRQNWPNTGNLDTFLFGDTLIWQRGKHGFRFGVEMRHVNQFRQAERFRRGFFNMTGQYTAEMPNNGASRANTGNGLADMLLGWASNGTYGNAQGENVIERYYAGFVQDDWKVNPKLTINMGLRWEFFQEPTYPNPDMQTSARWLTELNGVTNVADERIVFPTDSSDCGCQQDLNDFAPRLGIAYKLTDKTVIRTGGGIYYGGSEALGELRGRFFTGPPRAIEIGLPQSRLTTDLFVQEGFPAFVVTDEVPASGVDVKTTSDKMATMYSGQWFFDIQHQMPFDTLVTLAYMGQSASHLSFERNLNQPYTPHPTALWQTRRIRPRFNNVRNSDPNFNSNYNALTVKAEKRFTQGLTLLSSFTWSHNIDEVQERWTTQGSGMATPHNVSLEYGNSDLDRRLAYNLSWFYEIPLGKGKAHLQSGPLSWVLGNWQIGGILALQTGLWSDHSFNVDNQNLGGRVRGDWVSSPNLPSSQRSIDEWFNTSFVTASAPGVISNAGRNTILLPRRTNYDFILAKQIAMPWEGHRVQFRFESFNFTNTPQFGAPNTSVGSPAAGQITTADEPRRIQFALKYIF